MEILSNQEGQLIIKASAKDFANILGEGSYYSKIDVMRKGEKVKCVIERLLPGDLVDLESLTGIYKEASEIIGAVKEIKHSCANAKNQMTKLSNLLSGTKGK
jgi:hypothetical protein